MNRTLLIAGLSLAVSVSTAAADEVNVQCGVGDCYFCDGVRLSIDGGPGGVDYYGNGESAYVTLNRGDGAPDGDYQYSCSYVWHDGDNIVPKGCSGSFSVSAGVGNVSISVADPCEYSGVNIY